MATPPTCSSACCPPPRPASPSPRRPKTCSPCSAIPTRTPTGSRARSTSGTSTRRSPPGAELRPRGRPDRGRHRRRRQHALAVDDPPPAAARGARRARSRGSSTSSSSARARAPRCASARVPPAGSGFAMPLLRGPIHLRNKASLERLQAALRAADHPAADQSLREGWRLASTGISSRRGVRWPTPRADPVRRARDHHLASLLHPRDGLGGHVRDGTHMNLGRESAASASSSPAASANSVSTGPGHSAVTVTPRRAPPRPAPREYDSTNALHAAVAGLTGQRLERRHRGHVEHRAAAPRHHPGTNVLHRWATASTSVRIIATSRAGSLLWIGPDGGEPGVVDQHVDGEAPLLDGGGERRRGRPRRVRSHGDHLGADAVGRRQLVGERPQAILAPGDQGDAVALAAPAGGPGRRRCPDEAPVMRHVRSGAGVGRLMRRSVGQHAGPSRWGTVGGPTRHAKEGHATR